MRTHNLKKKSLHYKTNSNHLGINNPSDSVAVGNAPLVVFSYRVNSQGVASLASLGTEGTLVAEPADVGLHVLLYCVPDVGFA